MSHRHPLRPGFTLVEMLVVITIIGILAGFVLPAIMSSITRAKNTARKLEVDNLGRAVEQYFQKYGDYPPDGSDEDVLKRHMRKIFTRMEEPDLTLMGLLVDNSAGTTLATPTPAPFSSVAMDRGEALYFFLAGFSNDVQHPITGPSGPIEFKDFLGDGDQFNLDNYQANPGRENGFYDFQPERITQVRDGTRWISSDETIFGYPSATVATFGGTEDLLPSYLAEGDELSPIVYFDSRTYGLVGSGYNGFLSGLPEVGGVRPYKTEAVIESPSGATYATEDEAFAAVPFHNPDTYQIISPGWDGVFGAIIDDGGMPTKLPIHFVTESGRPVRPLLTAATPDDLIFTSSNLGSRGFQDRDWNSNISVNGNLDNVTNFSAGTILEDDLK